MKSGFVRSMVASAALALLYVGRAQAQSAHSAIYQTDATRSVVVTCSSGHRFSARVHWRYKLGITIEQVLADDVALPRIELNKAQEIIGAATFLKFVELWCSGDQDGGMRISYVTKVGGRPTSMFFDLIMRNGRLLTWRTSIAAVAT